MINKVKVGYLVDNVSPDVIVGADVLLFGFGTFGEISFKNELSGKTQTLCEMAKLSKRLDAVSFFGVETNSYGLRRKSVVACEGGRLIGISDATRAKDGGQSLSCGYKIYNTKKGRIGVLVDSDICVIDAVKSLSMCEVDLIIALSSDFCECKVETLASALSFLCGVAICFLSGDKMVATMPGGDVAYIDKAGFGSFVLSTKRKYYEYHTKSRFF